MNMADVQLESGNVSVVLEDGATIASMTALLAALRGLGVPEGATLDGFQIWDASDGGRRKPTTVRVSLSWRCPRTADRS